MFFNGYLEDKAVKLICVLMQEAESAKECLVARKPSSASGVCVCVRVRGCTHVSCLHARGPVSCVCTRVSACVCAYICMQWGCVCTYVHVTECVYLCMFRRVLCPGGRALLPGRR